jgi:alcohol dehydrogenase (cytochrome c)
MKTFSLNLIMAAGVLGQGLLAQGVDNSMLAHPPADSWPTYHGDYSARRHSSLTQISPANVNQLSLAWAFQLQGSGELKSSPLLVNGILYFSTPDNVWAVDARSGHEVWHYKYPPNKGLHIGHRGLGMYGDWLYFTTPDAHLVSLNAKDGKVRWDVMVADVAKGYWTTLAPLIVQNHVLVGASGDFDNLRGFLRAVDPQL